MKQLYTTLDDLPVMLNANQVASVLGISLAGAYNLMHRKGFPTLKIGQRMIVPKKNLAEWIGRHLDTR